MHPSYGKSMASLLQLLRSQEANPEQTPALVPIIPFGVPSRPARCDPYRPLIMGILNVTPDSFSDGETERVRRTAEAEEEEDLDGKTWLEHVLGLARQLIANGADILDIGGMSTRPGVSDDSVTFEEELSRVVPIIQAIRVEGIDIPISVDTFRPEVAEAAVAAGANCINDVRGGREAGMLETMSRLDVPVVLMHSRGNSISMTSDQAKDYTTAGGVLNGVKTELSETIRRAEEAGIKRWNTILDPGIGFAKTLKGNLELLRSLEELFGDPLTTINPTSNEAVLSNYNVLVGASRKGFIGTITSRPSPQDREYGNAAIIARCTDSGIVSIVRVHEPGPSKDVIMMTEAIKMG
jgi:dihydroneopterin aldolase/2-amino-4-hydroxy-6-hydroxymethyldihydropteridine diphosphokinase/dihydropteroate synthase